MKYTVLTLFPEITDAYFATSIMAKAIQRGIIEYRAINIRDFAFDKHKTCDDAPYGGGPGMLMLPEPLARALEAAKKGSGGRGTGSGEWGVGSGERETESGEGSGSREQGLGTRDHETENGEQGTENKEQGTGVVVRNQGVLLPRPDTKQHSPLPTPHSPLPIFPLPTPHSPPSPRIIYLSPSGKPFTQALAHELAAEQELILLCGRYEGIDQRIIDRYIDDEVSVGDYVLSSGEVAALALIDATYRLVDQVITPESLEEESFSNGLLEYPHYTRPEIFDTMKVPDVLLSGHHEHIRRWRLEKRVEKTLRYRPDLIRRGRELGLFDEETNKIIGDSEDERD